MLHICYVFIVLETLSNLSHSVNSDFTMDYNGNYEKRYDKLSEDLPEASYSLYQDDTLLLEM